MAFEHELGLFHNWCDRCCELCMLEPYCPAAHPTGTFEKILTRTREMMEKLCVEQGISLDDLPPAPMPGVDALVLVNTAKKHACALADLGLASAGALLAGKVARIASYLDDEKPGDDVWEADAVPNLMLLERLLADLEADIAEREPAAPQPLIALIEKGDKLLRGLLAPLFATIPTRTRQIVAALVAGQCAPSPFVRLTPLRARPSRDLPS